MKAVNTIWTIGLAMVLASCGDKEQKNDATGVFEATEQLLPQSRVAR